MALHGSKMLAAHVDAFLQGRITRDEMEKQHSLQWQRQFAHRLKMGRSIQRLFGGEWLTNLFITTVKPFPAVIRFLINQTHGKPF